MITIKGIPLLHEDECTDLFSADSTWSDYYYFIKPIYKYLPDTDGMDDEERANYKFKNVKEGKYLVGLEIISDHWVNKGFCGSLLTHYGLVLDEGNPIVKKGDNGDDDSLVYLSFDHIAFAVWGSFDFSVVP